MNCCISASSKGQAKRELHDARVASKEVTLPAELLPKLLLGWPNCPALVRLNTSGAEWHARRFTDGEVAHQGTKLAPARLY